MTLFLHRFSSEFFFPAEDLPGSLAPTAPLSRGLGRIPLPAVRENAARQQRCGERPEAGVSAGDRSARAPVPRQGSSDRFFLIRRPHLLPGTSWAVLMQIPPHCPVGGCLFLGVACHGGGTLAKPSPTCQGQARGKGYPQQPPCFLSCASQRTGIAAFVGVVGWRFGWSAPPVVASSDSRGLLLSCCRGGSRYLCSRLSAVNAKKLITRE